jgi:5-methyltetrahydrofolate--homocysteine methyltransferase
VILVAKANCGIPRWERDAIAYGGTPELMAEYVRVAHAAGDRIIGGCCGTSPKLLAAMRLAMDEMLAEQVVPISPELDDIEARLGTISDGTKAQISGEAQPRAHGPTRRVGRRRR